MCYILCHSQVPHLVSEYAFIYDFMDEFAVNEEPGYCVTTLSMVIAFLSDVDPRSLLTDVAPAPGAPPAGVGHQRGELVVFGKNASQTASQTQ
jgi:hypothetical protein